MRLVIVEDDQVQQHRLEIVLGSEKEIQLVGSFSSAEAALAMLPQLAPDVLLTDIAMPGIGGIELIRTTKKCLPATEILAFTMHDDLPTVMGVLRAGATGYVLKQASSAELVDAILRVHAGDAPMSPQIARAVLAELCDRGETDHSLSGRECEILKHVESGMKYQQIADKLFISYHTVHAHVKKICEKLQANGRIEAVAKAREQRII